MKSHLLTIWFPEADPPLACSLSLGVNRPCSFPIEIHFLRLLLIPANIKAVPVPCLFPEGFGMGTNVIPVEFLNYFKRCFIEMKGIVGRIFSPLLLISYVCLHKLYLPRI